MSRPRDTCTSFLLVLGGGSAPLRSAPHSITPCHRVTFTFSREIAPRWKVVSWSFHSNRLPWTVFTWHLASCSLVRVSVLSFFIFSHQVCWLQLHFPRLFFHSEAWNTKREGVTDSTFLTRNVRLERTDLPSVTMGDATGPSQRDCNLV